MAADSARTGRMGTESILKLLTSLSVPAILGMMINASYNLVDGIFIGRGVGPEALAGITVAFPVQMIGFAVVIMVSTGGSALFSIYMGRGNEDRALYCVGNSYFSILSILTLYTAAILLFRQPVLAMFGGRGITYTYALTYLSVVLPFGVFNGYQVLLENLTRAEGNARVALVSVSISSAINVALDYIFIFPLGWGVAGAALATGIAQMVGAAFLFRHVFTRSRRLKVARRYLIPRPGVLREIYTLGFSGFSRQVTFSVQALFLNNAVLSYGGEGALAILGILSRVFNFMVLPVFGILQGMRPVMSYNYGACLYDRARQTLRYCLVGATGILFVGFLLAQLFPARIIGIFTTEPLLIEQGARVLRIVTLVFPVISVQMVGSASFQAIGHAGLAFVFAVIRQIVLFIPLVLILPRFMGLDGIWWTYPVADLLALSLTAVALKKVWSGLGRTECAPRPEEDLGGPY